MGQNSFFNYSHPDPVIRRELVDLLYTSLPQVVAANVTALTGAAALAATTHDAGYVGSPVRCWSMRSAASSACSATRGLQAASATTT
jgi:hypothetical protein